MISVMFMVYRNKLHTLPEDQNSEKNGAAIKTIALFITAVMICISLFQVINIQDGEYYQPFLYDFCFQIGFMILGIFCPLYFCKDTPNFFIFVKNQMFSPPTLLPWAYSKESMELISHAKHLTDRFYLELLWKENSLNNRDLIHKELYRIKKQHKKDDT